MLQIHLFGYLRLLVDGEHHAFRGLPKTTSLLAYLLLQRDTAVSREHLAFLLWDDVGESEARANLRRHLHDLNRALPGGHEWVLRDSRSVRWNPAAPYWLDVAEFERLSLVESRLTEAVSLYTGDLLLASYDDEWLEPERTRLQGLYHATLLRLMKREKERGDLPQAMYYARRLLGHDPFREDVLREYMMMRHAGGDRAGAIQLYQQFERRLEEELGVSPMPETAAVFAQISGGPAAAQGAPLPATPPPQPPPPAVPENNLPARLTSFIGREQELDQICRLLGPAGSPVRLLTITGPSGIGKTRLALEAATAISERSPEQFSDGLYFIGLSSVADPGRLAAAIADTLGLRPDPGRTLPEELKAFMRSKRLLLVLDNFEHLLPAAGLAADLLTSAANLRLLVTSQAPLHLYGEHELPLNPLTLPEDGLRIEQAELLSFAAVRLFVERVQAGQPGFALSADNAEQVVQICRCLDGIPLALELAAARARMFGPAALRRQLNRRLHFLSSSAANVPRRHQTLRAAIDWSYGLLRQDEQALFAAAAFFAGSFSATAAQALFLPLGAEDPPDQVSLPDAAEVPCLLQSLAEKSMLRAFPADDVAEPRFRMLQTIRDYAAEQLAQSAARRLLARRFTGYFTALAEQGNAGMQGPEQAAWVRRLRLEDDNFVAAAEWLSAEGGVGGESDGTLEVRFVIAISRFWLLQGRSRELRSRLEQALALYFPRQPLPAQIALLNEAGNVAQVQGDYAAAEEFHWQALSLAREAGDATSVAHTLHFLAYAAGRQGRYEEAKSLFLECLEHYRRLPEITPLQLTRLLNNLAIVHKRLGEFEEAVALLEENRAVKRAMDDRLGLPATLSNLAALLLLQGDTEAARENALEALAIRRQTDDRQGLLVSLDQMAALATAQGCYGSAATLYAAADAQRLALNVPRTAADEQDHRRDMELIHGRLSPSELATCRATGARLSLEEATDYALAGSTD